MTSNSFNDACAKDFLARIGELLVQVGAISLHLQARARLHDDLAGAPFAETASAICRSADETRGSLAAMSRYCLQNLVPKTQNLTARLETVSATMAALAANPDAELRAGLNTVAMQLEGCCASLRGRTGGWPLGAGVIRLSEQRLWGAIAAELHRIEGTDGPIMRSCGEVERIAFEVTQAIGALLEQPGPLSLERRRDLGIALIRAAAQPSGPIGAPAPALPLSRRLLDLRQEWARLADAPVHIGQALSMATQASAQAALVEELRERLGDLQQRVAALAAEYRAEARAADRPARREAIRARLNADATAWQTIMPGIARPIELASEIAEDAGDLVVVTRRQPGPRSAIRA